MRDIIQSARQKFRIRGVSATGPFKGYNPTNVRLRGSIAGDEDGLDSSSNSGRESDEISDSDVALLWRSRDNRKGRRSIALPPGALNEKGKRRYGLNRVPRLTSSGAEVAKGLWRVLTYYPYWDMSFWVAFWYVLGSWIWVANGLMAWLPIAWPQTEAPGEGEYGVGLTTFFGVIAFQLGATLAYLEALNDGCWHGSYMKRVIDHDENLEPKGLFDDKMKSWINYMNPRHYYAKRSNDQVDSVEADAEKGWHDHIESPNQRRRSVYLERRGAIDMGSDQQGPALMPFKWYPTWKDFKEHYMYEVGFMACLTQLIGSCIFIITGIVALPGILNHLKPWQENIAYWIPQIVASLCFCIASALFMLETQPNWYTPAPRILGWWVGFWALVGSIGFELCACLGPPSYWNTGVAYQLNLSSFWGSCCFLISGYFQWYESVNKNPIEELFNEPGELKSWQVHPI